MKIVDKNGRLFGIINFVDLGIVVLILAIIVGGIYNLAGEFGLIDDLGMFETAPVTEEAQEHQEIAVTALVSEVREYTANALEAQKGKAVYDSGNNYEVGVIEEVNVKSYEEPVLVNDGELKLAEVPGKYDVYVVITGEGVTSESEITLQNEPLYIGTELVFRGQQFVVESTVVEIDF